MYSQFILFQLTRVYSVRFLGVFYTRFPTLLVTISWMYAFILFQFEALGTWRFIESAENP